MNRERKNGEGSVLSMGIPPRHRHLDTLRHIYVDCHCGCDSGLRIRIEPFDHSDMYCFISYTSADWNTNQLSCWKVLKTKLKKIWAIIRNKDYAYSEICLTKQEFEDFKAFLNDVK